MSEDMRQMLPAAEVPVANLIRAAGSVFAEREVDGVTISGGDPLEQPDDLAQLLEYLKRHTDDILLYTGFTQTEIASDPVLRDTAKLADVLVTGPYVERLNDGRALRGSSNQDIIFNRLNMRERYQPLLKQERTVQIGRSPSKVFLIGLLG